MEKPFTKELEKIPHARCTPHGQVCCTECNPVPFVTADTDPYYPFYRAYHNLHGRECPFNHKALIKLGILH